MTSQSAGAQWLRNPNSSFARPRNHPPSQQTPRSAPRQATIASDSTTAPAFKKIKVEDKGDTAGSNVHGAESLRRDIAAGNAGEKISAENSVQDTSLQSMVSVSEHDQIEVHTRKDPAFPIRPGRNAHRHHVSVEAPAQAGLREAVQIRPYVTETPASAPRYQGDGRFNLRELNRHTNIKRDRTGRLLSLDRKPSRGCPQRSSNEARLFRQIAERSGGVKHC